MRGRCSSLAILVAAVLLACGEDPVPKLEAEREALLAATLPKAEFWSAVERKGALVKQKRVAERELEEIRAKGASLDAERAQQEASFAQARDANAQTRAALAGNRSELERIRTEVAKREAALAGFERRRAEAPAP